MLRVIFGLLVLLNVAYFAWSQGYLQAYALGPQKQSEPQRLQRQLKPEALQVQPEPPSLPPPAPAAVPAVK